MAHAKRMMALLIIKMMKCTYIKLGFKRKAKNWINITLRQETLVTVICLMLKNVNYAPLKKGVIKTVRKQNHIMWLLSRQNIKNKKPFKKLIDLKLFQKKDIKLKPKIVN